MADNPHQISPGYIHAMKVLKVIGGGIFALAFMVGIVSMFSDREQLGIVALYAVLIGLFFLIIA